jgi:L-ascorbate metabolism protein UlaG (beta-lactamase superfamily)
MKLSQWGHACVRVERADRIVVIDPGTYSDVAGALDGADHVLVTHEHADHLDAGAVTAALAANPQLVVHGPQPALEVLRAAGVREDRLHAVAPGDRLDLSGVTVQVAGGIHAVVHPDIPRVANVGYLIGPVWHPGDSFDLPPEPARVLMVPVGGPWMRVADAIDFVRAVRPELALPIHDGMYAPQARALPDTLVSRLGRAGEYRRLEAGETLTV